MKSILESSFSILLLYLFLFLFFVLHDQREALEITIFGVSPAIIVTNLNRLYIALKRNKFKFHLAKEELDIPFLVVATPLAVITPILILPYNWILGIFVFCVIVLTALFIVSFF